MERTIFYSWQSESPSVCRNFIQTSLEKALRRLGKDSSSEISPVLDRDTGGVPGTPAISDEIFAKIVFSDVFVADVTLSRRTGEWKLFGFTITHRSRVKRSPNPNVLLELGFAVAHIGWNRIILVQNTECGGPDELPFDLRGRRTVTYHLSPDDADEKSARRDELSKHLEVALRASLLPLDEGWKKPSRWEPRWWGFWSAGEPQSSHGGNLFISETSARGFTFHFQVYNGSHLGQIRGFAELANLYTAEARIVDRVSGEACKLRFRRSEEDLTILKIEEIGACQSFRGMGAQFAGTFIRERESLFDLGFMNELELQRLFTITGQYFRPLMHCFGGVGKHDWIDTEIQGEAFFGLVRGLASIVEAIVMKGDRGELWVAYIDGDRVRYFTTEKAYKDRLPETINTWRSKFSDKTVDLVNAVNRIPNEFGGLEELEQSSENPMGNAPENRRG
jgi:hypothetical protein